MKPKNFRRMKLMFNQDRIECFKNTYRSDPKYFTRHRKISFKDLILFVLQRRGLSSYMEIYHFNKKKGTDTKVSTTAMKNQRMHMDPEVFTAMNKVYLTDFYKDKNDLKTFQGHLLIGVDGSDVALPTTEDLMTSFGYSSGKPEHKKTAMATISTAHDLLNGMAIDCQIEGYNYSERLMMREHMEKIRDIIAYDKTIITMDRGYFGASTVAFFKTKTASHFVFRVKSNLLKEQKAGMEKDDEEITLTYTKAMIKDEKDEEVKAYMMEKKTEKVRLTKVLLKKEGKTIEEWLLSDLKREEFSKEDLGWIYNKRWVIETSYDTLKNEMKLEEVSGTSERLIRQDIFATVLSANMVQDICQENEKMIDSQKGYKYEMKMNKNITIGVWKDQIVEIITCLDKRKSAKLYKAFIKELEGNLVPVRPGRSYKRKKIKKPRKSNQNKKKAI